MSYQSIRCLIETLNNNIKDNNIPVTAACYSWTEGGLSGDFVGYALTDNEGNFLNWVVLSGEPPASTEAIVECVVNIAEESESGTTVDVEYVCNEATGLYDVVATTFVDGSQTDVSTTATDIQCTPTASPIVTVDVEYVCNEATGLYDELSVTTTDGVASAPITTTTTISCGDTSPIVTVDIEHVCNQDSGVYDQISITTTDGVTAAPVITPTTINCLVAEVPDYEQTQVCDATTNTYHIITTAVESDGTQTIILDTDTGESCKNCDTPFTPECIKKRTFAVGYDNGITPGSSVNDCGERISFVRFSDSFTVESWIVNGQEIGNGDILGPFTGWTQQLQGWADWFSANDPNVNSNAAFGFKPAPTWRYAEITGCDPTAEYGPLTLLRDDGCKYTIYPVLYSDTTEFGYRYGLYDCENNTKQIVYCDENGVQIQQPTDSNCWVPCGYPYENYIAEIESPCTISEIREICDLLEDDTVTGFTQIVNLCDGQLIVENYTSESWNTAESADDLVEYIPQGQVVSCATGQPIEYPQEEKTLTEDCNIKQVLADCPTECATRLQITTGRPLNTVPWQMIVSATNDVLVEGATFQEFSQNLAEAGYKETIDGEIHYICPCPPEAEGQPAGTVSITADGNTVAKPECEENPEAEEPEKGLRTIGCNDTKFLDNQEKIIDLLQNLVDCMCGTEDCEPQDTRCESYNNPLTTGYLNWSSIADHDDLSSEFGCPVSATKEIWVRIVEHDCDGVPESTVGQIFGPYSVPQASGADQFMQDLHNATSLSCITAAPGSSTGPNGIGSNIAVSYDSNVNDATLVVQEGASDGAGGVCWYSSAQGFFKRGTDSGDFISSSGNGATTNYATMDLTTLENNVSVAPFDSCESI